MDKIRIKVLDTDQLDKVVGGSNNDDGEGYSYTTKKHYCNICRMMTIFEIYGGGRGKCTECKNDFFNL